MTQQGQKDGFAAWQKWALISVFILACASIVGYFNYRVFGVEDGIPYFGILGYIVLLSFIVTSHIKRKPVTSTFLKAAFFFEVVLAVILGINAAYSFSVQREMSIAGQSQDFKKDAIGGVAKLKGGSTQRLALGQLNLGQLATKQEVFAQYERVLFWILAIEILAVILTTFTLLGLSTFGDKDGNGIPDFLERRQSSHPAAQSLPVGATSIGKIPTGNAPPKTATTPKVTPRLRQ